MRPALKYLSSWNYYKNTIILDNIFDVFSEARNQQQHDVQYQIAELVDRIITIKGSSLNAVLLAEKNVQHKLRQFYEQDMNMNSGVFILVIW